MKKAVTPFIVKGLRVKGNKVVYVIELTYVHMYVRTYMYIIKIGWKIRNKLFA